MGLSRTSAARKEEDNPLSSRLPGLIGAVPERKDDGKLVSGEWLNPLIERAIDRVMSRKEAAILCGISEAEFSKQLAGVEGRSLNVRKLGSMGHPFIVALADEIRAHFKLDDPAARIERAAELVTRGLAMLVGEIKR